MPSYYDSLFGHFDEEVSGGTVYGGDNPDEERSPETEKEAGEAFDKMMDYPEKTIDRLFKKIWGGKFV